MNRPSSVRSILWLFGFVGFFALVGFIGAVGGSPVVLLHVVLCVVEMTLCVVGYALVDNRFRFAREYCILYGILHLPAVLPAMLMLVYALNRKTKAYFAQ